MPNPKFVVCYSLGTGAGLDVGLGAMSRQICEDLAEILPLNDDFITVSQMLLVRENDEISYNVSKNACAFAVFYSLPETHWIISATQAIHGDIAMTGRIVDDDSGLLLGVNLLDINRKCLLFCGCETCEREKIIDAIANMGAKILAHFTPQPAEIWLPQVYDIIGTHTFNAYANWMNVREAERRAQREGSAPPLPRLVENLTHALAADPGYERAATKLCRLLTHQLPRQSYETILRYIKRAADESETLAMIVVQAMARLGSRLEAEKLLDKIIAKYPKNGAFWLMRAALRDDTKLATKDIDEAKIILGNQFNACRNAVDNALLNVTGI